MNRLIELDRQLSDAFRAWSDARTRLGELRRALPQGQFAPTPEVATLFEQLKQQEESTNALFLAMTRIADERAGLLDEQWQEEARRAATQPGDSASAK